MGYSRFYDKLIVAKVELVNDNVIVKVVEDVLAKEYVVSISVNGFEIRRYIISEDMIKEFIVGNLYSMGLIRNLEEIREIIVNKNKVDVKVDSEALKRMTVFAIAPSCGEQVIPEEEKPLKVDVKVKVYVKEVLEAIKQLFEKSKIFKITGGVHTASLYSFIESRTLVTVEDLGRHSAVDKVIGWGLLRNIDFSHIAIVTSGRVFSDMVAKAVRAGIPLIISKSAPSYEAVLKAREHGITLVGFARGNRFNVYSEPYRIAELEKIKLR